jgi:hypothetical protein
MKKNQLLLTLMCFFVCMIQIQAQSHYKNFKVSVYTRAQEVQKMGDQKWLDSSWQVISSQLNVDKIYIETHRDLLTVDKKTVTEAKKYFEKKGLKVAGGITYTINEGNMFETFCYTNPDQRKKAQEIIEFTASIFDEIILDDFFFTSCKCEQCVKAKGDKSWSEYRLELMAEAAENLIIKPAKAVNPNVKVIIKYPNWYDHFHELGFNLDKEPKLFDGIYTGTETRDAVSSNQHLQPYLGYLIFRYFNNLKPGKNGGGWVDTGGMRYYDRYAEQLWLTILAKAPEMTLFDYNQMLMPLRDAWLPAWKGEKTSFDYSTFLPLKKDASVAKIASHSLDIIDKVAGNLGNPVGIKSYKPYHSSGEDFLQNYFGMIGIPMDIVPEFPMNDEIIILTEQAKKDPEIVGKIKQRLLNGKDVIITSGLLNALQDRGIRNIVNLEYTSRKSTVSDFLLNWRTIPSRDPIQIPQIQYYTNDSWEIISGMDNGLGWPLLHQAKFANATLYVLVIPENFADLYVLPVEVLDKIREICYKKQEFILSGTSMVSIFIYDNNTFVLESFKDTPVEMGLIFSKKKKAIIDIGTNENLASETIPEVKFRGKVYFPERYVYKVKLQPHSFRAFKME